MAIQTASLLSRVIDGGAPLAAQALVHVATLTGNIALDSTWPNVLSLVPGAARDVTLDPVADSAGLFRLIINRSGSAHTMTCKNVGGDTIGAVAQNRAGLFFCDGATWSLCGYFTTAAS